MSPSLDTSRFLEDLTSYRARNYLEATEELLMAHVARDKVRARDAREHFSRVIRETLGACEVLGATIMLRRAAQWLPETSNFSRRETHHLLAFAEAPTQTVLPRVTFEEAVQDMVRRTPVVLRKAAERTAARISQLYESGNVIAFVRSADQAVTERVQKLYAEALRTGITEREIAAKTKKAIEFVRDQTADWSEAYSRMAFRTNANTAITAGRFRQARDPDIQEVIPAFQFQIADQYARDNHKAADGLVMTSSNPLWHKIAPPLGYNCRCDAVEQSRPMLRRAGLLNADGSVREATRLPAGAHADGPPFSHIGRPDLFMNAVAG
jgi:SPP1 gp7 family putative phage head morphogenesis protein